MYEMTLIREEVRTLRKANIALSKRRKAKRTRIQAGGALSIGDTLGLIEQKEGDMQQSRRRSSYKGELETRPATLRYCGQCGKIGHNIRTYQEVEKMSEEEIDVELN